MNDVYHADYGPCILSVAVGRNRYSEPNRAGLPLSAYSAMEVAYIVGGKLVKPSSVHPELVRFDCFYALDNVASVSSTDMRRMRRILGRLFGAAKLTKVASNQGL